MFTYPSAYSNPPYIHQQEMPDSYDQLVTLYITRVKTKAGTRAFYVAAPTLWNSLPTTCIKLEGV